MKQSVLSRKQLKEALNTLPKGVFSRQACSFSQQMGANPEDIRAAFKAGKHLLETVYIDKAIAVLQRVYRKGGKNSERKKAADLLFKTAAELETAKPFKAEAIYDHLHKYAMGDKDIKLNAWRGQKSAEKNIKALNLLKQPRSLGGYSLM